MSDIKKGYTFTDKSTDWVSNKETAIRLNKMLDDAKINLVAGTNISIAPTPNGPSISATGGGGGTITAVTGTLPIVSTGTTAPDISINAATTLAPGSMSAADKTKLNGIADNANNYSLPKATSTVLGGVELFSDTVQSVAANAVTTTASRTYGVQLNNVDQMVVNVPWIDSTFAAQTEKTFFAGPASGSPATPTFRAIASTDLPAFGSGDVSFALGGAGTIAADAVNNAKMADMAANTVKVNATAGPTNPTDLAVGTNTVVGRGATGNIVAAQVATGQIADNAVTNAKAAQMATQTIKGRTTAGTGNSEDLTATQATAILNPAVGATSLVAGTKGLVPAPAIGEQIKFLRGDMTYQTISGGGDALTSNPLSQFAATTSAQLAGVISDETGTGSLVFATSPNLTTPALGVATGTSFNSITGLSSTTPLANGTAAVGIGTTTARADHVHPTTGLGLIASGLNQFAATTSAQLAGVINDETGTGSLVFATSPTLVTPALGTPTSGLLNSCTSNPNATGASARTFQARAGDVFNVKDFGATGDGSTNDTTAISNAIAAAIAAPSGGAVFFPRGTYLTARQTISSPGKNIRIFGEGEASQINSTSAAGVLEFIDTGNLACFAVTNIRLMSDFGGVALKFNCNPATARHDRNLVYIDRVTATCFSTSVNWTAGIQLSRAHNAIISNSIFDNLSQVLTRGDTGLQILEFSVGVIVTNCNFSFWNYGVRCEVYQEGLLFSTCLFIGVKYGAVYTVPSDSLRITSIQYVNCNFDARGAGNHAIFCNNVQGLLLSNNYFIGGVSEFASVFLRQVQFSTITGNKFFTTGDDAIQLLTSSPAVTTPVGAPFPSPSLPVACSAVAITGNTFFGDAVSVRVGVNCVNIVVQNNVRSRGGGGNTAPFQQSTMEPVTLNTVNSAGGTSDQNYIQP